MRPAVRCPPAIRRTSLLITLDTVGADHLSLYGYGRPTSPVLERLAGLGIRFDEARAAAPWTLPSHATMFTGRWHHDLSVDWTTPLDTKYPTLADYLELAAMRRRDSSPIASLAPTIAD